SAPVIGDLSQFHEQWEKRRCREIGADLVGSVGRGKLQLPEEVERPLVCCCLLVEEAAIEEALLGQRAADEAGKNERCAVIRQRRRDGRIVASALLLWLEGKCRGWVQMRVLTVVDRHRTDDGALVGEAVERRTQLHQWRSSSAPRAAGPDGEEGIGDVMAAVVPQKSERKR
ncbi:hypothetical protein GW17_00061551, partial [Ensete ventricosum]